MTWTEINRQQQRTESERERARQKDVRTEAEKERERDTPRVTPPGQSQRERERDRAFTVIASSYKDINLSFFVTALPGNLKIFIMRSNRENPIAELCVRVPEV